MEKQNQFEVACLEWIKGCSCAPDGKPWECEACTEGFHKHLLTIVAKQPKKGCEKHLAEDQWFRFCGETDMGQTAPALCTECGGEYKLAE